ncbi:MAG TPA: TRAP transporter small permease subunit [Stellaceae bacterium]|nr:TRAP transporter small permease subunit [Stellaceae bacterium]
MMVAWLDRADRAVGAAVAAGRWLALPVSVLLFAQWPLRDLVHAYSTDANDLAQWLFALYVSLALTYATRMRSHLAADVLARRYPASARECLARLGAILCIAPWALFILVVGTSEVWQSLRGLEHFPETLSPGYFLVKVSAWLLALLALAQALIDALRPRRER